MTGRLQIYSRSPKPHLSPGYQKYSWYFGLLKLTLRYQRSEAIAVFKEAIASLNRATTDDSKFLDSNQFADFLPASLLVLDELR